MSTATPAQWSTAVGTVATRAEMSALYGGAVYSGISPSAKTANILIYTDPAEGIKHGYIFDGASRDGTAFFYTGHGPVGDQSLTGAGNGAILDHVASGRALRLFDAVGVVPGSGTKTHQYLGEYRLDPRAPYRREPHVDRTGATRTVLVFRLLPLDGALLHAPMVKVIAPVEPATAPSATIVSREVHSTEFYETAGTSPAGARRTESALVEQFEAWHDGPELKRWAIRIPGEGTLLLTDAYDEQAHVLYEAKAAATRSNVRLAIGQLADYRRHIPDADLRCAILLPERPTPDLCELIASSSLTLTYPDADGAFHHEAPTAAPSSGRTS